MRRFLLVLLFLLVPTAVGAQGNTNTMPPMCTATTLLTVCVPQVQGAIARISDATDATVCTNSGAGTTVVTCQFNGTSWGPMATITVTGGTWTGANGETITNTTNGTFTFTRDGSAAVTITSADDAGASPLTVTSATTGVTTIGSTSSNATSLFSIDMKVLISETPDTVSFQNEATGSVVLDFRDYGDTTDDDMAHGAVAVNCGTTTSGAEECNMVLNATTEGNGFTILTLDTDVVIGDNKTATFAAPNTMTADSTALNQYIGIPKLNVTHTGALANGTTSVAVANPLIANCSAIVNGAEADDATNFITGAASYKYTFAADVAADDGIDCVIAYPAVTDPVSFGFWFRTDTAIASGDIDINFDDGGVTDGTISTLAVTVLNEWQWIEMNITTACSGDCSAVDGIEFLATTQGAGAAVLDDAIINIDQLAMWKVGDETAIGDIQVGGLIDFVYTKAAQDQVNTGVAGVEWTSHFINYQTGADAIIPITDLSTYFGTTLEALND